jgi:outer membrane protein assembly factor BamB
VVWKVALPSASPSTPAVWGSNIVVTCPIDGRDGVLCFDREGNERWRVQLGPQVERRHKVASGSNSSPLTNGEFVFVYYKSGTIAALTFAGSVVWKDNLQERYGKSTLWWDLGTSPVLAAGNVVVAVVQEGDSYVVALDASTGKEVWKEERIFTCPRESDQSYSTPSVVSVAGKERILVFGADHLTAHDASTGKTLWTCEGFNPAGRRHWRTISSASVWNGIAVLSYGRGGNLCGIDLRDNVDASERWLWKRDDVGVDVPTPITWEGKAYVLEDKGRLVCVDIMSGEDLWSSNVPQCGDKYYASPIVAGDNLYCAREKGGGVGRHPRRGCSKAATNRMNETVIATPIPIDGRLLIRGAQHLFCLGM